MAVGSGVGVGFGVAVGSGVGVGFGVAVGSGVGVGFDVAFCSSVELGVGPGAGVAAGTVRATEVSVGSVVGAVDVQPNSAARMGKARVMPSMGMIWAFHRVLVPFVVVFVLYNIPF